MRAFQALTASFCGDHAPLTVRGRVEPPQVLEIAPKADGIYTKLVVDDEIAVAFPPDEPAARTSQASTGH